MSDLHTRRPVLKYVEYPLVEHCNLSCKRCAHFSPLADPDFADPESFERDLRQLAKHFSTISRIRLLGGEPLLHPTPEAFIDAANSVFPNASLRIVTNGSPLKAMHDAFWSACRRAKVTLDLSLYPTMEKAAPELQELCEKQQVRLNLTYYESFFASINPRSDSDPERSMAYCRSLFYCPFLKDSRLYVCALPVNVVHFNKKFHRSIATDPGIDIFDPALDGEKILKLLETPVETCRSCACLYDAHRWEHVRDHAAADYDVSAEGIAWQNESVRKMPTISPHDHTQVGDVHDPVT